MLRRLIALLAAGGAVLAVQTTPALPAAAPVATAPGADVSHPQCPVLPGQPMLGLPAAASTVVVGVNDGVATGTNPCLAQELAWAADVTGGGLGSTVALYLNTANPGRSAAHWPGSNHAADGSRVPNPHGTCRAPSVGSACAFVYGWRLAVADLARPPAPVPAGSTWYLDVEAANTWSRSRAANLAVLEGMSAALTRSGARVGVYANRSDWAEFIGPVPASSTVRRLPTWLAGAVTRSGAAANCTHAPLPGAGRIERTQYLPMLATVDSDLVCGVLHGVKTPTVTGTARSGHRLTAHLGVAPAGVHRSVRWLRNGRPIARAVSGTYVVRRADRGAHLTVRVTATRSGFSRVIRTSASRSVAR